MSVRGIGEPPVSALAVIDAAAPKLMVATAKAADPALPGMCRI